MQAKSVAILERISTFSRYLTVINFLAFAFVSLHQHLQFSTVCISVIVVASAICLNIVMVHKQGLQTKAAPVQDDCNSTLPSVEQLSKSALRNALFDLYHLFLSCSLWIILSYFLVGLERTEKYALIAMAILFGLLLALLLIVAAIALFQINCSKSSKRRP